MSHLDHREARRNRVARLIHATDREPDRRDLGTSPADKRLDHKDPFVRLDRVSKTYDSGLATVPALDEIDLEVAVGEFVAVCGSRGSGKTTLIELIGGTQRPTTGSILVGGRRFDLLDERGCLEFRTANVALAPQTLAPTLSVYETVVQAARTSRTRRPDGWLRTLLASLDLHDAADLPAGNLSAEGQQRLSVARALAKNAPLLLLDDPLSAADVSTRQRLLAGLRRLAGSGTTVVLTTRDENDARVADRVVYLRPNDTEVRS